jgi:hypothetical protein
LGDSIYDSEFAKIVGVLKPQGWPIVIPFIQSTTFRQQAVGEISRGYDGWETSIDGMRHGWPVKLDSLNSIALAPDGRTLAIGNADGKIRLITLK